MATMELPIVGNAPATLELKLAAERRPCPVCGYEVGNPLSDRCPRCFGLVPRSAQTDCGSCTHQGNCQFVQPSNS
jgi:hypothetical protein